MLPRHSPSPSLRMSLFRYRGSGTINTRGDRSPPVALGVDAPAAFTVNGSARELSTEASLRWAALRKGDGSPPSVGRPPMALAWKLVYRGTGCPVSSVPCLLTPPLNIPLASLRGCGERGCSLICSRPPAPKVVCRFAVATDALHTIAAAAMVHKTTLATQSVNTLLWRTRPRSLFEGIAQATACSCSERGGGWRQRQQQQQHETINQSSERDVYVYIHMFFSCAANLPAQGTARDQVSSRWVTRPLWRLNFASSVVSMQLVPHPTAGAEQQHIRWRISRSWRLRGCTKISHVNLPKSMWRTFAALRGR